MQTVKGLTGNYHATTGEWATRIRINDWGQKESISTDKLKTLCGASISPNYRRMDTRAVNCDKCLKQLKAKVDG